MDNELTYTFIGWRKSVYTWEDSKTSYIAFTAYVMNFPRQDCEYYWDLFHSDIGKLLYS